MSSVIEAARITYQSGYRFLLNDINWRVEKGQHWVVFGQNGSGKTTLLSILAGFKQATGGQVRIYDQTFSNERILKIRQSIGWVSSSFFDRYYHKESVLDIVLAGKSGTFSLVNGLNSRDIIRAKRLLRAFHLGDKINRSYDTLSKGERQSALIVRALFAEPQIYLLDEPGTGLDVQARASLLSVVRQLAQDPEITIVYVTHHADEILDVFEHALFLKNGCVYAQGETKTLFTEQRLSEFFEHPVSLWRDEKGRLMMDMSAEVSLEDVLEKRADNGSDT